MSDYTTELGSLDDFRKGGVHIINDDPRNYVFSNAFEVARQIGAVRARLCGEEPGIRDRDHARGRRLAMVHGGATTSSRSASTGRSRSS